MNVMAPLVKALVTPRPPKPAVSRPSILGCISERDDDDNEEEEERILTPPGKVFPPVCAAPVGFLPMIRLVEASVLWFKLHIEGFIGFRVIGSEDLARKLRSS